MTTHLLKVPAPIDDMRTRCNLRFATEGEGRVAKGDMIGANDSINAIDCLECLRETIVELRMKAFGDDDSPAIRWFCGGDTGISSQTIWSVMMMGNLAHDGRYRVERVGHPLDPADFGRCYRLLREIPAWRARLGEVAAKHPSWAPLVANWDELTALYEEELKNKSGVAPKLLRANEGAVG